MMSNFIWLFDEGRSMFYFDYKYECLLEKFLVGKVMYYY